MKIWSTEFYNIVCEPNFDWEEFISEFETGYNPLFDIGISLKIS